MVGLATLGLVGAGAAAMPRVKSWWKLDQEQVQPALAAAPEQVRVTGRDTLTVPPDVAGVLGVETAEGVAATGPLPLSPLSGTLALDANYLTRVHARFAGEVVEIGTTRDDEAPTLSAERKAVRPLRYGDAVEKGQLLAVLWSKDLGEKKSELVDAVSRLRLSRDTLTRLQEAFERGAVPERSIREAERNVEGERVAVARAERTLRSWRLSEAEIDAVRAEADRLHDGKSGTDRKREEDWARVDVRAPLAGTILEKNVAVGDLVDPSADLFKIADLTRLTVWANAYEEDLPALQALPRPIHWTVRLKSDPRAEPRPGTVSKIGDLIDPNQHTAPVVGHVDNVKGQLRAGQFITATIELPPPAGEVEIPTAALVEDGQESVVFVQPDPSRPEYTLRRVAVARRYHDLVYVRSLPDGVKAAGGRAITPLKPGERVVTAAAVELKQALEDEQTTAKAE